MKLTSAGLISGTEVDGTSLVGLWAADGSQNMYDASADGIGGSQHPSGALRVFPVDGTSITGRTAPNGAMYVINAPGNISGNKPQHPCGAMQTNVDFTA